MRRQPHRQTDALAAARDRLGLALLLAGAVHGAVILGLRFDPEPARSEPELPTLDVLLVQSRAPKAPEQADFLAQAHQLGGGDSEQVVRPASPDPAPFPAPEPEPVAAPPPPVPAPAPARARPPEVVTRAPSAERTRPKPSPAPEAIEEPAPPSAAQLIGRSMAIASLTAEIDRSRQSYAKRLRHRFVSASTREARDAMYLESWRKKVEQIGNLNYPEEAKRQHLSGSLRLEVVVNADGTVSEVNLLQSSGYPVLDDAAMRIVHLAAPFAPLPETIRKDTDVLHIIRTWQFRTDNQLTSR